MSETMVMVRARCPLSEDAVLYPVGAEFSTTLERAEALGDSVSILLGAKADHPEQVDDETCLDEGQETAAPPQSKSKGKSSKKVGKK
ncbi:MAG: hypothetical protein GX421_12470 [Caldisericales bacterium]|nr:hypothetical protein [Caldisericales bacterium]